MVINVLTEQLRKNSLELSPRYRGRHYRTAVRVVVMSLVSWKRWQKQISRRPYERQHYLENKICAYMRVLKLQLCAWGSSRITCTVVVELVVVLQSSSSSCRRNWSKQAHYHKVVIMKNLKHLLVYWLAGGGDQVIGRQLLFWIWRGQELRRSLSWGSYWQPCRTQQTP